jgi:mitochondrial import inner membrane translocase subunit TIM23
MSFDWLLGKRSSSSTPPSSSSSSQSSSQSSQSSSPFASSSQGQTFEAPSVDSILKPTDPARLHPLANLDKEDLEYIILEDEQIKSAGALPSRGWSDDLCYGTGATYLSGPPPHFAQLLVSEN